MMTREDMLRELELLPIWRLRNPLPTQFELVQEVSIQEISVKEIPVQQAEPLPSASVVPSPSTVAEVANQGFNEAPLENVFSEEVLPVEAATRALPETEPQLLTHVSSDDGDWLFVFKNQARLPDEALLLGNIFMAMGIRTHPLEPAAVTVNLLQTGQAKIVIAMGEQVAQYLLQSTEGLANLRGTVHALQGVALVVSYDSAHLLQVVADKEKSWNDLCLALQTLQRLKSVS